MRRCDREIQDFSKIEAFLKECRTCRLAIMDEEEPYIVPLNFGYEDKTVYLHGAKVGKKLDLIQKSPRVCLEWDREDSLITDSEEPCRWGMKYISVIAWGNAELLQEEDEKITGLNVLMKQFSKKPNWEYNPTIVKNTAVIKIVMDKVSGKEFS